MPRRTRAKEGGPASALPSIRVLAIAGIAGLALSAASAAFSLALISESSNPYLAARLVPWLPKAQARIGAAIALVEQRLLRVNRPALNINAGLQHAAKQ